ncbi:hypothetical protein [Priestia megaterium]|uniref:hypothetical protein n=1 Tax=Priestia megaterium TaxID=1404 RepID=UPI000EFA031C|nr:hypothetical protein [Priestia megaterium]RMA90231.1 hypothetical protein DEU44_2310 [Priestia megaterium]
MARKKTHQEFMQEVFELVGVEYNVLGQYVNSNTKIKMQHIKCDYKYEVPPSNFLSGSRCPKCYGKKKKTTEIFKNEVYELVNNDYTVLEEYTNDKTKIKIKHNICDYVYSVQPSHFLQGKRCPKCAGVLKKTTEIFKEEVFYLVGDEYKVLGEYITARIKIKLQHVTCNYKFEVTPDSFLRGSRCAKCARNLKRTTKEFKEKVYSLVEDEYIVLGEYLNTNTRIKMKHNKCGYEYDVTPAHFLNNRRCPKCKYESFHKKYKKSKKKFEEEVYNLVGDEFTVVGEYINAKTKVKLKHNECGYEWVAVPKGFLDGNRCPKCKESKGEKAIGRCLATNNIEYKIQYKFNDCVHENQLSFDVAVFEGDSIIMLIEYDGGQHFKAVDWFGGQKAFELTKIRDRIKEEYCKEKKISLLRIPYWEFNNIEKILKNTPQLKPLIKDNEEKVSSLLD